MTDNVVLFSGVTFLDLDANLLVKSALDEDLETLIMIGCTKAGDFYFKSNKADGGEVLWWLEKAKWKLMQIGEENDR